MTVLTPFRAFVPEQRFAPALAMSPDGSRLAYSCNASGQFNVWLLDLRDGSSRALTDFTDHAVRDLAWAPDGNSIAFIADHRGNEQHQVHVVPAAGGEPTRLTQVEDRQFQLADVPFTRDGGTLVFTGNDRDERCRDVLLHDLASGGVRRVETSPGLWAACSVSPDGRWLLALQLHGNANTDLHLLDLHDPSASFELLTEHTGDVVHWAGPWSPDSSGFHLLSDEGREFTSLRYFSLADRSVREVTAPEWDVERVTSSRDGAVLAWTVNVDGASRLHLTRDGVALPLPELPAGTIAALTLREDGDQLAVLLETGTRPADVVLVDVAEGSYRYLTDSRPPALQAVTPVAPELVQYPTHDGLDVPAWLYRPTGDGPFPVVLSVHGGPEAQERPTYPYSGLYQYLLSRGVGVLAPNVRGSTGYGKSYQKLIHRDWGGAELGDLEHAALYLRSLPFVDADRLAVFGGSFGGFAALSCLSRLPQYWAAGVSVVGPSNLVTLASSVPATWRPLMAAWIGDPETEREFLLSRSPITYADQIVAPLMVVQGANDPRVVKAESDQIVEALRGRGVEVRYDVYDDEGHGFTNRDNEIRALSDVTDFLTAQLLR
jgi:dipeptidyl aminopeptidase/acylaminoacyl peptidase